MPWKRVMGAGEEGGVEGIFKSYLAYKQTLVNWDGHIFESYQCVRPSHSLPTVPPICHGWKNFRREMF